MAARVSIPQRRWAPAIPITKRARLNDVLSLRRLIEDCRDDLTTCRHELRDVQRLLNISELSVSTSLARFESIVAIYNRLVVEYEPQDRRA